MSSYYVPLPDLPATFESLNDDTLTTVLEFVGNKSYAIYAGINKHCKEVYLTTEGMTKETFLYGYGPLTAIKDRYNNNPWFRVRKALGKGIVLYNRLDVLDWALEKQDENLLKGICYIAAEEGRTNLLEEMWNNVNENKRYIFRVVGEYAALRGKLEVLKWLALETKGLYFNKKECACTAAHHGQLQILEWLRDEQDLQLIGVLYYHSIKGNQLLVMKWLREQACPWDEDTFYLAAKKGNLDVLQWLHDERCPWDDDDDDYDDYRANERRLKPEVVDWLRANGYGNRLY